MPTIQMHWEDDPNLPNQIGQYAHCRKGLAEIPKNQSPAEFARTQIGIHTDGRLQVWCRRHDCNIAIITPKIKEEAP